MSRRELILGTRGSQLALTQANMVKSALVSDYNVPVAIKAIQTVADKVEHVSLNQIEGKGFFIKELEEALLDGEIDLAVHSLKDLMTTQPQGLKLGAVGFREDRREALIMKKEARVEKGVLPVKLKGVVGAGSVRRYCQIAFHNPLLKIKYLRGNVTTRIEKLREGEYDAIIIAAAGIKRLRLDLSDLEVVYLDPEMFLPAPGQGLLGIQIRSDDHEVANMVGKLNSRTGELEAYLERGLLSRFESGCSLPLGVYSQVHVNQFRLKAVLGQKVDDRWAGLKTADVTKTAPDSVIDEVFKELSTGL
jgi:hydroxymethylbilane synthase